MAHWEEEAVYKHQPEQLKIYNRFLDDLVMVWDGDMERLAVFMNKFNNNNRNIKLSWNVSTSPIVFLGFGDVYWRGQNIDS